jgi:alkylhydroperoxidase family enzyme
VGRSSAATGQIYSREYKFLSSAYHFGSSVGRKHKLGIPGVRNVLLDLEEVTNMKAYIEPPKRTPLLLRLGTWIAERMTKKTLLPARLLAWYPKAAVGAGVMESLVAHEDGAATVRLLKLVRMQVSFMASCPFCIDMNSTEFSNLDITHSEIEALQGLRDIDAIDSLNRQEKLALRYARALTKTPITLDSELLQDMLASFSKREFVVIVSTISQVNFWARLIQGLGVPPAGFSETCSVLRLEEYTTLSKGVSPEK